MYILIVTGLSGAGKSTALRALEDLGYYCVDNLPCALLGDFVNVCAGAQPPVKRAAVAIDARESRLHSEPMDVYGLIKATGVAFEILFLDCRDEIVELRYSETRRTHPIQAGATLREKIQLERELLKELKEHAHYLVDTTQQKPLDLMHQMEELLREASPRAFNLTLMSFGYKRGIPNEADMVLDVRFSPNPFYEKELKHLSGYDPAVKEFVLGDPAVQELINSFLSTLDKLIPRYMEQGKHRLTVALGCTGGRHRSVAIANEMYRRVRGRYPARVRHRDLGDEGEDIKERFQQNGEG